MRREETARWRSVLAVAGALLFASSVISPGWAQQAPLSRALNEQVVFIRHGLGVELETTIFKPDGDGPFPLVVINHGKAPGDPSFQERARYPLGTREFVRRGYVVVVPMRQGFSKSTGGFVKPGCNITSNGQEQAHSVQAVIEYLKRQPFVDKDRILVVGQSHGGLTTLAIGSCNIAGVRGLVNFAGGLRAESCAIWESSLVQAVAEYAKKTRVPSLWFYGENDSYFSPDVFNKMYREYTKAGGKARLVNFGRFGTDSHGMFSSRAGLAIWVPEVEKFLESLELPHKASITVSDIARPAKSGFAAIDDVMKVPFLKETGREGYRAFLTKGLPRAFALSPTGHWGWANEGDDPTARAIANCQKHSKEPCRPYAVDDDVVWQP